MGFFDKFKKKKKEMVISGPIGSDRLNVMMGKATKVEDVVFAGHGSFNTVTEARFPKVRLPPSVTLVFWCRHGEELLNTVGAYIESRKDVRDLPDHLIEKIMKAGYSKDVPEIVPGGSEIYNYRLTYPSGLALGNKPESIPSSVYNPAITSPNPHSEPVGIVGDRRYCVVPALKGTDVKDRGVPILALIAAHWNKCDGAVIHWCACRSIVNR